MSTSVSRRNSVYGYPNPQEGLQQEPIVQPRNPTTRDAAELGTIWINTVSQQYFILTSIQGNVNVWISSTGAGLATLSDNASPTPHVVPGDINANIQFIGDAASGIQVVGDAATHTITISNTNRNNFTVQTVNAVTKTLAAVGVMSNTAVTADVLIVAARSDYSAMYSATGNAGYKNQAGTLTILPNSIINPIQVSPLVSAVLTSSGTSIEIQVTGEAGQTWNWSATVQLVVVNA